MSTKVDIVNSAFSKVGVEPITSFDEDSKSGRLAKQQYPIIRDNLLYEHYWNFAIKRVSLALSPDRSLGTNKFIFTLPTDMIRPIELVNGGAYRIEGNTLITHDQSAILKYVYRNTDTSIYTPRFREALAWRIAADFSYTMVQSVTLMDRIEAKAEKVTLDAASTDAQDDFIPTVHDDTFLDARFDENESIRSARGL